MVTPCAWCEAEAESVLTIPRNEVPVCAECAGDYFDRMAQAIQSQGDE